MRAKRPVVQRKAAESRQREQDSILEVIKQFQANKESYVYLLACGNRDKIGYSNNIGNRVRTFNTASPDPHKIVAVAPGGKQLEGVLHESLKSHRIFGEWFSKAGPILEEFKKTFRSDDFPSGLCYRVCSNAI